MLDINQIGIYKDINMKKNKINERLKMKKSYRVEVEALAYFDIEANNPEEAKNKVPKSMQMSVEENSSVFFEEFDWKKATVTEQ